MAFGDNIKRLRAKAGITQRSLAKKLDLSQSAIQRWENNEGLPQAGRIAEIADVLGVTQTELLDLESELGDTGRPGGRVPLISWVQAGHWAEAVDLFQPGVADEWIPVTKTPGPNAFALTVSGDSMVSPYGSHSYPHGTIIVVDPSVVATPGRRVVAKLIDGGEHQVTFKELQADAGRYFLKPLNPQYPTIEVDKRCEIVGTVVASYRQEV